MNDVEANTRVVGGKSNGHIANLDLLRAVGALSVTLFHLSRGGLLFEGSFMQRVFEQGYLGVDIFFVISGFVIPLALYRSNFGPSQVPSFLKRRFVRLYPAYFVAGALAVGLWFISSWLPGFRGTAPELSFPYLFTNATLTCEFFGQPWIIPVFWTLAIEAQYYVLVALCFPLLRHATSGVRLAVLLVWLALPLVGSSTATVFPFCALFGMGILLFLRTVGLINQKLFVIMGLLAFAIQWSRDAASAIAGMFCFLCIAYAPEIKFRPLASVGVVSYSLYLMHVPIGGRVINLGARFGESPILNVATILVALAVTLIAAFLFYRLVEKPSHEYSKRLR
jgi:peptidoglycan/LPS O-acetylase OafA/YrhL